MTTDQPPTRRELVRGGAAAGAAATLAAAVPALLDPTGARGAEVDDAAILVSVLRVEHVVVYAYQRALAIVGALPAAAQPVLSSFLGQERAHVRALGGALDALGIAEPAPPATLAAFESELRRLRVKRSPGGLRTPRQHLRFLIDLETTIARHYRFAIARLHADEQVSTAAEIMANEAQHATVLSELLSPGNIKRAVPTAFVAGVG